MRIMSWATNPLLRRVNAAIVLLTDSLAEIHPGLVTNAAVTTINVPLPDAKERQRFAASTAQAAGMPAAQMEAVQRMAAVAGGLTLESLRSVLTMSARDGSPPDGPEFAAKKKDLIERSCQGLIEFIQPRLTLDAVAGHAEAKNRLESDARAIKRGQFESAPMGYLICGPVGTARASLRSVMPAPSAFRVPCSRTSAASMSARRRATSSTHSMCSADSGRSSWSSTRLTRRLATASRTATQGRRRGSFR